MNFTLGKNGLIKSWQADFPATTECCRCNGGSRIGFVAHEGLSGIIQIGMSADQLSGIVDRILEDIAEPGADIKKVILAQLMAHRTLELVCELHSNEGKGGYWLHDRCAVAIYFCKDCLETTALYNQA